MSQNKTKEHITTTTITNNDDHDHGSNKYKKKNYKKKNKTQTWKWKWTRTQYVIDSSRNCRSSTLYHDHVKPLNPITYTTHNDNPFNQLYHSDSSCIAIQLVIRSLFAPVWIKIIRIVCVFVVVFFFSCKLHYLLCMRRTSANGVVVCWIRLGSIRLAR